MLQTNDLKLMVSHSHSSSSTYVVDFYFYQSANEFDSACEYVYMLAIFLVDRFMIKENFLNFFGLLTTPLCKLERCSLDRIPSATLSRPDGAF